MASVRQTLEDAFMLAIAGLSRYAAAPKYLTKVAPYSGDVDADDFRRITRGKNPAVLVSAKSASLESQSITKTRFTRTLDLDVYVLSDQLRDRVSRNRSDVIAEGSNSKDPGAYQIIEDIHNLVAGQVLSPGFSPLMPSREDDVLRDDGLSVWQVTYQVDTPADVTKLDLVGATVALETLRLQGLLDGETVDDFGDAYVNAESSLT